MLIRSRVIIASIAAILLFAWQDILLWQRIFETDQLWQYAGTYHVGWRVMLDAMCVLSVFFLWGRWLEIIYFVSALKYFEPRCVQDLLYYLLDCRSIPSVLPWLDGRPQLLFTPVTDTSLIISVIVWIVVWIAFWVLILRTLKAVRSYGALVV